MSAPRGHDARQADTAPPKRRIPCRAIFPAATPQLSNVSTFHIFFLEYRLFSLKCQEKSLPGPHFTALAAGHTVSRLNDLLRRHSCSAQPRCDIRRRIPIPRNGQNHGRTCAQPGILKKRPSGSARALWQSDRKTFPQGRPPPHRRVRRSADVKVAHFFHGERNDNAIPETQCPGTPQKEVLLRAMIVSGANPFAAFACCQFFDHAPTNPKRRPAAPEAVACSHVPMRATASSGSVREGPPLTVRKTTRER